MVRLLCPSPASPPMGFSWAFHLAHECHVHLARQCLPKAGLLVDRREAPILGQGERCCKSGMLIYADNNNHFGPDRIQVNEDQKRMIASLHDHGLATHEVSEASTLAESLGVRLNGAAGEVSATPSRDWRLYRAIGALIHGGQAVSGGGFWNWES